MHFSGSQPSNNIFTFNQYVIFQKSNSPERARTYPKPFECRSCRAAAKDLTRTVPNRKLPLSVDAVCPCLLFIARIGAPRGVFSPWCVPGLSKMCFWQKDCRLSFMVAYCHSISYRPCIYELYFFRPVCYFATILFWL